MIRFLLFLIIPFRSFFNSRGVNFEQLTTVIRLKLMVDNRTSRRISGKNSEKINSALLQQGFSLLFFGTVSFLISYSKSDIQTAILLFHSMILVMLVLSLLSEYTQMLFDPRDIHILSRMPVNALTLSVAKLITLGYYIFFLTLCAAIIPLFIVGIRQGGISGLLFLLSALSNSLFALLITNLVYRGCLHFLSKEKFQNILSYIQIGMVVLVVCSYQILLHTADFSIGLFSSFSLGAILLPPAWFTSISLLAISDHPCIWYYSGIGIIIPLLSAYVSFKWFTPYFSTPLNPLESQPSTKQEKAKKEKIAQFLTSLFARHPLQKSGFMLSWRLTSGNRKFKEAIVPAITYMLAIIIIQLISFFQEGKDTPFLYMPLYFSLMVAYMITDNMKYNEQGNQLWIYQARPLIYPGQFILGAFKAVYIKYFIPLYCGIGLLLLCLGGIRLLDDIVFIFTLITLITLGTTLGIFPFFPFAQERNSFGKGKILLYSFLATLLSFAFIFLHWGLQNLPYGIPVAILLLWGCLLQLSRRMKRISWEKLEKNF